MSDIPDTLHIVLDNPAKPSSGAMATYSAFETERHARGYADELRRTYLGEFKRVRLSELDLHRAADAKMNRGRCADCDAAIDRDALRCPPCVVLACEARGGRVHPKGTK